MIKEYTSQLRSTILGYYYFFTAYMPRRIPKSKEEFEGLKNIFIQYYGIEDRADTWMTVIGQMTSVPATSMWKSYGRTANAARRLRINAVLQEQKQVYIKQLEDRLKELTKQVSDEFRKEEESREGQPNVPAPDFRTNVQLVQEPSDHMV